MARSISCERACDRRAVAGLGDDLQVRFTVENEPDTTATSAWSSASRSVLVTSGVITRFLSWPPGPARAGTSPQRARFD
jgi:hypothetical protein